jgi:hypothetical protein
MTWLACSRRRTCHDAAVAAIRLTKLLQQRAARLFKRRLRDHDRRWRIGRSRIIHSLYLGSNRGVLWLGGSNVHRRADSHQRVKFCRRLAMQPNATMRMGGWMYKPLMKTVGGSKLAPITHWISDITARAATGGGYYSVALHAEPIRSRPLVLLFGINSEAASRRGLRSHTNINGGGHQTSVAFHYVNVLLRERNQHSHPGWVIRLIRGDVVRPARAHMASCRTAGKQQERRRGAEQD